MYYQPGGTNWRLGKGKPPLDRSVDIWTAYLNLWKDWAERNPELIIELAGVAHSHYGGLLSDRFATTEINQARALATVLNERFHPLDLEKPIMISKLTAKELLTVIMCVDNAVHVSDQTTKETISAIHNVVTWSEETEDHQLVRLKAFAPEVCDAYLAMLNAVRQVRGREIPYTVAVNILRTALHLEKVFTVEIFTRMISELQHDADMRKGEIADNLSTLHEVGETLERIFNKS